MKTHRLLPLLLLAGCASIDQAALIYSSRITGGLDLSASGTESQGVALNIGFKTVDFAYVPVAVAASAPGGMVVTPLGGSSREDLTTAAKRSLPAAGVARVQAFEEADKAVSSKRQSVEQRRKNLAGVRGTPMEAELSRRLAESERELQQSLQQRDAARGAAQDDLEQLQQGLRDAMSVYGSFNGRGEGAMGRDKPSGALTMGRVFSTGVAAQKLTKAALIEASSGCLQRYLTIIERAPAASQAELAAGVGRVCKPVDD